MRALTITDTPEFMRMVDRHGHPVPQLERLREAINRADADADSIMRTGMPFRDVLAQLADAPAEPAEPRLWDLPVFGWAWADATPAAIEAGR